MWEDCEPRIKPILMGRIVAVLAEMINWCDKVFTHKKALDDRSKRALLFAFQRLTNHLIEFYNGVNNRFVAEAFHL